jgi:hypothetical protein
MKVSLEKFFSFEIVKHLFRNCGGCERLDDVCSFVHEGYFTRAPIHKELCKNTPNELYPPRPYMALVITSPPHCHSKAAVWKTKLYTKPYFKTLIPIEMDFTHN